MSDHGWPNFGLIWHNVRPSFWNYNALCNVSFIFFPMMCHFCGKHSNLSGPANVPLLYVTSSCQPVLQLEHNISSIVCFGHYIVYYATWSCSSHGCDAMSQQGSHLTTDMLWYIMTYWENLPLITLNTLWQIDQVYADLMLTWSKYYLYIYYLFYLFMVLFLNKIIMEIDQASNIHNI